MKVGSQSWKNAVVLIAVLCLCFWTSVAAAAGSPQAIVQTGTNQVMQLLREYPLNSPTLKPKIRAVVDNYFDFQAIAKNAIGPEWRQQTPEKRKQFTRAFSRLLIDTYLGKIDHYSDHTITYAMARQGPENATVRAYVTGAQNMAPLPIDYYLHRSNGTWKVYDVVVEGIGLVSNYREQFSSILVRTSFDDLLRQLETKSAQG
ncbi:MAG: ABC transporter substrate-binding protein [Syntrophobacteraceae bacterium]|nr:ABC transporter substrate-binding protein [Syntrophobacteraceae bacterium]